MVESATNRKRWRTLATLAVLLAVLAGAALAARAARERPAIEPPF